MLEDPAQISHYRILGKLGAGGMGVVYRARDTRLDREVALKLLPADFANDADRLRRFEVEARATSALNHPNILTVHDFGLHAGAPYLVLELLEGAELHAHLKTGALPLLRALDYAGQTAAGLAAAHAKGIVHRDLKPENLFVTTDGRVKILDFGLAKLNPEPTAGAVESEAPTLKPPERLTDPGAVLGTASYMSPEQARGQEVDVRSDIFSLGLVLYEMLAGRAPFAGVNTLDVIGAILHQEPAPLLRYAPDTPAELQRIVTKTLRKDREQRYQHSKDLLLDLTDLQQELAFAAKLKGAQPFVVPPSGGSVEPPPAGGATKTQPAAAATNEVAAARTNSSAEIILGELQRHKLAVAVGGGVLLVLLISLAYGLAYFGTPKPTPVHFQNVKFSQLTTLGNAGRSSLSPDGKLIAYFTEETGKFNLWTKAVATGSVVEIVSFQDATPVSTTFSPDGNYVYYVVLEKGATFVLYQVPVLGGTPKKVLTNLLRTISFSPDGQQFAYCRRLRPNVSTELVIVKADGSGERVLYSGQVNKLYFYSPAWSPDGETLAVGSGDGRVYAVAVKSGALKPLTEAFWDRVVRVAWFRDGSGLVILARERNARDNQLWRLSLPSGTVQRLTNDLNSYDSDSLSMTADGSQLLVTQGQRSTKLYRAPTAAASQAQPVNLKDNKLTGFAGVAWMPDGRIVYVSNADGKSNLWLSDPDGSHARRLTDSPTLDEDPAVSPDGRTITFDSLRAGTYNVWRMDHDGSNLQQLTHGKIERYSHFSPDGKWIVYDAVREGGFESWKMPLAAGGTPVKLTENEAALPTISPDGKLIACYLIKRESVNENKIAILPFVGGAPLKVLEATPALFGLRPLRWAADGLAVFYVDARQGAANIWRLPLDGSPAKPVTDFKDEQIWSFDVSRDGKQFLIARGTFNSDVVLIRDLP